MRLNNFMRGSSFGALAAIQAFGNLAASAVAGVLWTAVSPTAAFLYLTAWMVLAVGVFATIRGSSGEAPQTASDAEKPGH